MRFYKAVAICSLYALIIDNKALYPHPQTQPN